MKKYIAILIAALLTFSLGACSVSIDMEPEEDADWNTGNADIEEQVDAIDIDWANGAVDVVYGDGDTVSISENASGILKEEQKMIWTLDGTTLKIRYIPALTTLNENTFSKDLTVVIPVFCLLDDLDIDGASCEITTSVNTELLDIDTASGSIRVSLTDPAREIDLDTASADIYLTAGDFANMKIDSASGNIEAAFDAFSSVSINTASGNVILTLPADSDFTADIDTASGDFDSELELKTSGKKYICGDGSGELNIDTASGNVSFKVK